MADDPAFDSPSDPVSTVTEAEPLVTGANRGAMGTTLAELFSRRDPPNTPVPTDAHRAVDR
jgi:hypothetical protein